MKLELLRDKEKIARILKMVFSTYSFGLLDDIPRLNALLMDYIPLYEKERKILIQAFDLGVGQKLQKVKDRSRSEIDEVKRQCVSLMESELVMQREGCIYAVDVISYALGISEKSREKSDAGKTGQSSAEKIGQNNADQRKRENRQKETTRKANGNKEKQNQKDYQKIDGKDKYVLLSIMAKDAVKGGKAQKTVNGKTHTVDIPPGTREGNIITLKGMGEKGKNGGKNGNLILKIHIMDIYKNIRISEAEAAQGCIKRIDLTNDDNSSGPYKVNESYNVSIPAGIESGRVLIVKRNPESLGYIEVKVFIDPKTRKEQRPKEEDIPKSKENNKSAKSVKEYRVLTIIAAFVICGITAVIFPAELYMALVPIVVGTILAFAGKLLGVVLYMFGYLMGVIAVFAGTGSVLLAVLGLFVLGPFVGWIVVNAADR